MKMVPIDQQLQDATSILDLARRLGEHCLCAGGRLVDLKLDRRVALQLLWLEQRVAAIDRQLWFSAEANGDFSEILADHQDLRDALEVAATMHPLDYLGVLRGLLFGVIPQLFEEAGGEVCLDRGMPIPWAIRPLGRNFGLTPHPATLARGHLLDGHAFSLFRHSAGEQVAVVLDYSERERIDQLTWSGTERLPKIGAVYPTFGSDQFEAREITPEWFFSVGPKQWDAEAVLAQLEGLAEEVEVAVLPELSLPHADELEQALGVDPERYPALIVAGSAHIRDEEGERRHNESRVYLDGRCIMRHHKSHPYFARELEGIDYDPPLPEGITTERKVLRILSGEFTRLAIVICADLNDDLIPLLLDDAGVNLLLVPALTSGAGSFNGILASLSSRRQAVGLIVNAGFASGERFRAMVGLPRPAPAQQSDSFEGPPGAQPCVAVLDPAQPLAAALSWR